MHTAPVSANIVTKNPDMSHLGMTLRSLANQNSPPAEVIIVDSTPGGHAVESADETCSVCTANVNDAIQTLRSRGSDVILIHDESAGLGGARRIANDESSQDVVWHLDEDAVIVSDDWTERALGRLDDPGVSGVGGNVAPLRPTAEGKVLGTADTVTRSVEGGWYIMYPKRLCQGERCVRTGQDRGEDISTRNILRQHGEIVREPEILAKKDLPTQRQKSARNVVLGAAGGAVAGAVASKVLDAVIAEVF